MLAMLLNVLAGNDNCRSGASFSPKKINLLDLTKHCIKVVQIPLFEFLNIIVFKPQPTVTYFMYDVIIRQG